MTERGESLIEGEMSRKWELWKKRQFDDFLKRYEKYSYSDEARIDYLAHIYFLLNGATIVQQFDFMEMEVGIGFREVH